MRAPAILPALLAALAACSAPVDRRECASSPDCPAGEYCARTPDGKVCWPDGVPPRVASVSVSCPAPCLRDSTLRVEADVTDDAELGGAEVLLDVDAASSVRTAIAMAPAAAGGRWRADVPLRRFPFEHFARGVVATVRARDGARNVASLDASAATTVTRLRFSRALDSGVFSLGVPAVMQDGTVVTAGTNGKVYFVPWDGSGVASTVAVGTGQITAAPLVLGGSVWIGSEDGKVYEVTDLGTGWSPAQRADTGGAVRGSLSATSTGRVIACSQSGFVYSMSSSEYRNSTPGFASALGSVLDSTDALFLFTGGSVRRFTFVLGAPTVDTDFSANIGASVSVPLAFGSGVIVAANNGAQGLIRRVDPVSGAVDPIATTTGAAASGIVILSDGGFLVPEESSAVVSRWTSSGGSSPQWVASALGADPRTPLVVAGGTRAPFIVPTAGGHVHALADDGRAVWTTRLGLMSLQPANIYTPPGQPAGEELSTAYLAGSDGVLHAVIVDGKLDAAAPWPKAFHDARNTNRAGGP